MRAALRRAMSLAAILERCCIRKRTSVRSVVFVMEMREGGLSRGNGREGGREVERKKNNKPLEFDVPLLLLRSQAGMHQ